MKKKDTALAIVKALAKHGTIVDHNFGLEKCKICDFEFFTVNGDNHRKGCPVGRGRLLLRQLKTRRKAK